MPAQSFLEQLAEIEAILQEEAAHLPTSHPVIPKMSEQRGEPSSLQAPLNQFAFDLFAQRLKEPEAGNVLISPTSIALALGMVLTGTVNQVEEDMMATMHLSHLSREEINQLLANLQNNLSETGDGVKLAIANSLWSALGRVELLPDFVERCHQVFEAEAATLDFSKTKETLEIINGWVNEKTFGKIEEIATANDLGGILILLNAIYFKGSWSEPFSEDWTDTRKFHFVDGTVELIPTMIRTGEYACFMDERIRGIRLPYGDEERFATIILVPCGERTVADLAAQMNTKSWSGWLAQLSPTEIELFLPRFKIEDEWELNSPLEKLGMASAFNDASGFQRMLHGETVISKAIHKTVMEVNEEGTVAAAVTMISMSRSISFAPRPPMFKVDRPFVVAIHDAATDSILFLGQVVDPR